MDILLKNFETKVTEATLLAVQDLMEQTRAEMGRLLEEVERARLQGLAEVEAKRKELDREIQAMEKVQLAQDHRVELDVGGQRFATSLATLRSKPGNMLDAMFSGRHYIGEEEDGSVFLDRDGSLFGYILEYLRTGVVAVGEGDDRHLLRQLKTEFDYFCIDVFEEEQEVAFAVGGHIDGVLGKAVERYDFDSDTWTEVAPMLIKRHNFGMAVLGGELYATGGFSAFLGDEYGNFASVEKYSPSTDTWTAVTSMPYGRSGHSACVINDVMYVLGGWSSRFTSRWSSTFVLKYTPATDSWSETASMPEQLRFFGATVLGNDIYVVGGLNPSFVSKATVYRFNTVSEKWSTVSPMSEARSHLAVCELGGMIYAVGGDSTTAESRTTTYSRTVERYDPQSDSWTTMPPISSGRSNLGVFTFAGCMYVAGGSLSSEYSNNECMDVAEMEKFDPLANKWFTVTSMNYKRSHFNMGLVKVKNVNLFDSLIAKKKISC